MFDDSSKTVAPSPARTSAKRRRERSRGLGAASLDMGASIQPMLPEIGRALAQCVESVRVFRGHPKHSSQRAKLRIEYTA